MSRHQVRTSYGVGRYVTGEGDVIASTRDGWVGGGTKPGLIVCPGHGRKGVQALTDANETRLLQALAKDWIVMIADLGSGDDWANATQITRIGQARTYLQGTWGAKTGKIGLLGGSMGGAAALAYARANPTLVACVAGVIPLLDIADIRDNNRSGYAANINAAYGGTYSDTTHGPSHSPVKFAGALPDQTALPIRLWTSSDDPIIMPATVTAFLNARPSTVRTDIGPVGHDLASWGHALNAGLADFLRAWRPA